MARYATTCKKCGKRYTWDAERCFPIPDCPHCKRKERTADVLVSESLSMAEEIQSLADDLPDEGAEFGISVSEKAAEIAANIEKHNRVTDNQYSALENMLDGLRRWFND